MNIKIFCRCSFFPFLVGLRTYQHPLYMRSLHTLCSLNELTQKYRMNWLWKAFNLIGSAYREWCRLGWSVESLCYLQSRGQTADCTTSLHSAVNYNRALSSFSHPSCALMPCLLPYAYFVVTKLQDKSI